MEVKEVKCLKFQAEDREVFAFQTEPPFEMPGDDPFYWLYIRVGETMVLDGFIGDRFNDEQLAQYCEDLLSNYQVFGAYQKMINDLEELEITRL